MMKKIYIFINLILYSIKLFTLNRIVNIKIIKFIHVMFSCFFVSVDVENFFSNTRSLRKLITDICSRRFTYWNSSN